MAHAALFDLLPDFGAGMARAVPATIERQHAPQPVDPPLDVEAIVARAVAEAEAATEARLTLAHEAAMEAEREANAAEAKAFLESLGDDVGKTIASLAFLVAAEVVALPAFVLFFAPLDGHALTGVVLASIGICAVGSLVSAMAAASRGREVLLPLIFLPLAIPIVVGGVGASISEEPGKFLAFLGLYDAVFAILSWAAFEYVVTE